MENQISLKERSFQEIKKNIHIKSKMSDEIPLDYKDILRICFSIEIIMFHIAALILSAFAFQKTLKRIV